MKRIIWKIGIALILMFLIYAVIDADFYRRMRHDPDNRWLLKFHQKYLRIKYFDKYGHFFMSGFIALFLNILLNSKLITIKRMTILLGSLIVALAFTLMEIHHYFIPNRNFELLDLFFTYAGIFIIGGFGVWIMKAKQLLSRTHKT